MRTALYARVSTERQERQQTIDSQLAALRAWAVAGRHALPEEHVFRDEGYSGSRLDRPGLDALRDAGRDGAVDLIAVVSPDRLARRCAYQVLLLLEEFRRAGCEVAFLNHPGACQTSCRVELVTGPPILLVVDGAVRRRRVRLPRCSRRRRCGARQPRRARGAARGRGWLRAFRHRRCAPRPRGRQVGTWRNRGWAHGWELAL